MVDLGKVVADAVSKVERNDGRFVAAPWTYEQTSNIKAYQECNLVHSLTCGNGHGPLLVDATHLDCLHGCGYRQTWVPANVANGSFVQVSKQIRDSMLWLFRDPSSELPCRKDQPGAGHAYWLMGRWEWPFHMIFRVHKCLYCGRRATKQDLREQY